MIKKILKGISISSAALMITAGAANADVVNVNIYGASAQYTFWTNAAADFLQSTAVGCGASDVYTLEDEIQSRDVGAAVCAGNTAVALKSGSLSGTGAAALDNDTVIIRYTSKASYDGIRAVSEAQVEAWDGDSCHASTGNWGERLQANLGNATVSGQVLSLEDEAASLSCQDVQIGASDVASETFAQTSSGQIEGPLGGGSFSSTVIYPQDLPSMQTADGFLNKRPVVVPFGFFANDDTTPVPIDDMTRLQAVSILSGQITDWDEVAGTTGMRVVLCHRHAGSGTVATLNAAVFRGDGALPTSEVNAGDADFLALIGSPSPEIYFNEGSSDLMRCVGQTAGAIGYADYDKCLPGTLVDTDDDGIADTDSCVAKGYGPIKRVLYNGAEGTKSNVQNGVTDFWSAQWLYYKDSESGNTLAAIEALGDFASLETNLPSKKAPYWSSQAAMNYEKSTDFALPRKK